MAKEKQHEDPNLEFRKVETLIFKFSNEGDEITGELLKIAPSGNFGNDAYYLRSPDDLDYVVFSTSVLASKMINVKIGQIVRIVYTGNAKNKRANQNDIKLFDVYVKNKSLHA